ncbi:MAG: peptide ABC transporter substrate-binding protein [Tissierellia bacterium]|nr:peptide ABC transporter substrate-binding protein [Tissierellia bacterium]
MNKWTALWKKFPSRTLKLGAVALSALVLITACGGRGEAEVPVVVQPPASGGAITVPLTNFDTLNPLLTTNEDYHQFSQLIYNSLYTHENDGSLKPQLAEHVERSEDGKRLTVTLKEEVYFQDGAPLTAKDVAETFNAMKKLPADSPMMNKLRHSVGLSNPFDPETFAEAKVFDERNVDFEFQRPYAGALSILTFPILPAHLLSQEEMIQAEDFRPLGTGPYQFVSYTPNREIVLKKNPNYFSDVAYAEEIYGKIYADADSIREAYDSSSVDLFFSEDYTWDRYRADENSQLDSYPTNRLEVMVFNLADPTVGGHRALRQAISQGVNRRRILDSLYLSQGVPVNFFLNPEINTLQTANNDVYSSVDASRELLRKAGFRDVDGDGYLELPDGSPLRLRIRYDAGNDLRSRQSSFLLDDLQAMGIEAQGEPFNKSEGETLPDPFQVALVGMSFSDHVDLAAVLSSQGVGSLNMSGYQNDQVDQWCAELSLTTDKKQQRELIQLIREQFLEDAPMVPLFFLNETIVRSSKLTGDLRPNVYHKLKGIPDLRVGE